TGLDHVPRQEAAMFRRFTILFALLSALPIAAAAATTPPGVNLRWDQCLDDGGTANRFFACDTNAGGDILVGSFVLDAPQTGVNGLEIVVDLVSESAALPEWWAYHLPGSCRRTSLVVVLTKPIGSVNCVDWASELAS